ncbi:MAG: GNAT family N-acetyltransferase [Pseudomonadota bacterium]
METIAPGAEILRTERLILRRFRMADVGAYFEMMNQPAVEATLLPGPETIALAGREMAMIEGHWALVGFSFFAVEERSTGLLIGRVGPWAPYGQPGVEVGWTIHPRRGRRGHATEAASAAGRWILEQRADLSEVIHIIARNNRASQVVAKKLGGEPSGRTYAHPLVGTCDIWATPREAFFQ